MVIDAKCNEVSNVNIGATEFLKNKSRGLRQLRVELKPVGEVVGVRSSRNNPSQFRRFSMRRCPLSLFVCTAKT